MHTTSTLQHPQRLRPFEQCQVGTPLPLRWWLGRPWAPSLAEHQAMAQGLVQGDPLMDAFVEAAYASGKPATHWAQLRQACQTGQVPDPQNTALQALMHSTAHPPFELDAALLKAGVNFTHSLGRMATDVLRDLSLMGGYLLSAFNQTLVLTGALEKGAAPRLASTSDWWLAVTANPNTNQPGMPGFAATLHVRWIHAMVRRQVAQLPEWNGGRYGLPVNQVDMAATYLGFSLVMLLGVRKLGIWVTPAQSKAVMHLWKWIAWQMGVDARWLVDTEQQAIVKLRQFLLAQTPADHTTVALARALAQEPLQRHFDHGQAWRQRWAYWVHLSSVRFLVGGKFKHLGLRWPPGLWIKPITVLPRLAKYYPSMLHPTWRGTRIHQGRLDQEQAVAELHRGHPVAAHSSKPMQPT